MLYSMRVTTTFALICAYKIYYGVFYFLGVCIIVQRLPNILYLGGCSFSTQFATAIDFLNATLRFHL